MLTDRKEDETQVLKHQNTEYSLAMSSYEVSLGVESVQSGFDRTFTSDGNNDCKNDVEVDVKQWDKTQPLGAQPRRLSLSPHLVHLSRLPEFPSTILSSSSLVLHLLKQGSLSLLCLRDLLHLFSLSPRNLSLLFNLLPCAEPTPQTSFSQPCSLVPTAYVQLNLTLRRLYQDHMIQRSLLIGERCRN